VLKKDEASLTNNSFLELRFMLSVKSIIDYAHGAGKKVILEGVETTVDLQLAKQLQVDYVQGFYFKKQFKQVG
jgi:EAL domain-containing protein (putative c-di-GMP-specific phosphodiesterase class I)